MKLEEECQARMELEELLKKTRMQLEENLVQNGRKSGMIDKLEKEKKELESRLQEVRVIEDDQLISLR